MAKEQQPELQEVVYNPYEFEENTNSYYLFPATKGLMDAKGVEIFNSISTQAKNLQHENYKLRRLIKGLKVELGIKP